MNSIIDDGMTSSRKRNWSLKRLRFKILNGVDAIYTYSKSLFFFFCPDCVCLFQLESTLNLPLYSAISSVPVVVYMQHGNLSNTRTLIRSHIVQGLARHCRNLKSYLFPVCTLIAIHFYRLEGSVLAPPNFINRCRHEINLKSFREPY